MRKFWFAIIVMTILYADSSDGDQLHNTVETSAMENHDESEEIIVVGDMLLTQEQLNYLYSANSSKRLGVVNPIKQWPNATVSYAFDKSSKENTQAVVLEAMNYIQNVSCVRFIPHDRHTKNYVLIKEGKACSSKIGMQKKGAQSMIIDGDLCTKGNVIHELLHTLGFLHMHTANIRDDYVKIKWINILEDSKLNFKRYKSPVSMYDTEYDYDSITHYGSTAFAKNKSMPTIIAKSPAPNMGQRIAMSVGDIIRVNRMYNCSDFQVPKKEKGKKKKGNSSRKWNEAQFSNGNDIIGIEAHKMTDNTFTNDLEAMKINENKLEISDLNLKNMHMEDDNHDNNNDEDDDDMVLTQEQFDALYSLNAAKRNGLKSSFSQWPLGIVPFEIDPTFSPEYISIIHESMDHISNRSCIRFVKREPYNKNFVYISRGPKCVAEVGMQHTGGQLMNINEQSCPRGRIIHELLHSLGFLHMHTANERDYYIQINWSNIQPAAWANFKQFVSHVSMFSTPYDYNSIMHYSTRAFAIDKSIPTIIPIQHDAEIGQRKAMSDGDIMRLNRMYKCKLNLPYTTTSTTREPSLSSTITPIETSTTDVGVDGSEMSIESSSVEEQEGGEPRTILGVLIFKLLGRN